MKLKNFTKTRFWIRLGQPNVIGHNLLFVALIAVAILSFTFDAVRLQNYSIMWLPVNLVGAVIVLAVAIPVLLLKRNANELGRNQPTFNILFAGFCMGLKNLTILPLAALFGIADSGVPVVRFLNGFVIGVALLILYSNVVGTRIARTNSLNELRAIEVELKKFRFAVFSELEDESRIAAQNAAISLIPQLQNLKILVQSSNDLIEYADRLSKFVSNEIRPFAEKLAFDAVALATAQVAETSITEHDEEVKIRPFSAVRFWLSVAPIPFCFYLLSLFALPVLTQSDAFIAAFVFALSLLICKIALVRVRPLSISEAFATITVVAFVASIPSYLLLATVPTEGAVAQLIPTFLIIPAWLVISSSMTYILDLWQATTEAKLTLGINDLARENKLYEQKAWLARHGWYLMLHGIVQPAITSASVRAASAQVFSADTVTAIEADLQRALDALSLNEPPRIELSEGIENIQQLWQGVCDVKVDLSESARKVLEQQATACLVLNEVLKEVVSNSVRHGNASKTIVSIGLDDLGDIKIVSANDGKRPLGTLVESLGSRMLDAVCVDRSLLWNEETQLTEFRATIPVDHK